MQKNTLYNTSDEIIKEHYKTKSQVLKNVYCELYVGNQADQGECKTSWEMMEGARVERVLRERRKNSISEVLSCICKKRGSGKNQTKINPEYNFLFGNSKITY